MEKKMKIDRERQIDISTVFYVRYAAQKVIIE